MVCVVILLKLELNRVYEVYMKWVEYWEVCEGKGYRFEVFLIRGRE